MLCWRLVLPVCFGVANAFVAPSSSSNFASLAPSSSSNLASLAPRFKVAALHAAVDVTLEKPLGLVLEENTADGADGLYVAEITDSGSACKNADVMALQLGVSLQLQSVDGVDVTALGFDDVMELIGDAASPVRLTFEGDGAPGESSFLDDDAPADDDAATCAMTVVGPKGEATVVAEKGANLRAALLGDKQAVYSFQGTLMNCNGGGQCGLCRVLVEDSAFDDRSEYEDGKLKGKPGRLACQTVVSGASAKITLQPK
jgi:ferredoxin